MARQATIKGNGRLMIKVMLADKNELVVHGIKAVLNAAEDMTLAHVAQSGEEALSLAKLHMPHVVLIDPQLDGSANDSDDLKVTRQLLKLNENMCVIGFSSTLNLTAAKMLLSANGHGYLCKDCSSQDLLTAIRTTHRGENYVPFVLADRLSGPQGSSNPFDMLSEREREVCTLKSEGLTRENIAIQLGLSVRTVNIYRHRSYSKLQITTDIQLFRLAVKHQLVQLER